MSQTLSQILHSSSSSNHSSRSQVPNPQTQCFKEIVRNAGIILSPKDGPNIITQEAALVVRDMHKILQEQGDCEATADKFVKGFQILVGKEFYMRKALLPTQLRKPGEDEQTKSEEDSLFRILLQVDVLQNRILSILRTQMSLKVSDPNDTACLCMILKQLRFLPDFDNCQALASTLLELLDMGELPAKLEILYSLPQILPDRDRKTAATVLNTMLGQNDALTCAIIDCLNEFNLEDEIRAEVQTYILGILHRADVKTFPVLYRFILTDCNPQDKHALLPKIRDSFDAVMQNTDIANTEKESGRIVVFTQFQYSLLRSVQYMESWCKFLTGIKEERGHKPIDLLILFILYGSGKVKKRTVDCLVRRKVKCGHFAPRLLEQLFRKYMPKQLMRQYYETAFKIGSGLFRTCADASSVHFAQTLFCEFFTSPCTGRVLRDQMLNYLIQVVNNMGASAKIAPVLKVFTILIENTLDLVVLHDVLFLKLLDTVDRYDLKDVKVIFEILCRLACAQQEESSLREEVQMIVRKQLAMYSGQNRYRGVVCAVVLAKHLAITEEDQSDLSLDDTVTMSQLQGDVRQAATLLELAKSFAAYEATRLGLFYDQLAWLLLSGGDQLDRLFVQWLNDTQTSQFQELYITEQTTWDTFEELGCSVTAQYNLNEATEAEELAVNVAELSVRKKNNSQIMVLASHFRLLRLCQFIQQNGDLGSIDALLGFPVILPCLDDCDVDTLETSQLELISDALFYCINWFRELINAFVTQKRDFLKHRVVSRLAHVIELEAKLDSCLANIPEYRLPQSYFNSQQTPPSRKQRQAMFKEPKRPKKKARMENEESTSAAVTVAPSSSAKKKPVKPVKHELEFREMDPDVLIMLQYPLISHETSASYNQIALSISQLNFLLNDFVRKLTHATVEPKTQTTLDSVKPKDFITDSARFLAYISQHFTVINAKIKELVQENDGELDGLELYTPEAIAYKTAFGLTLEILSLLFNWPGFAHLNEMNLLKKCMEAFRIEHAATASQQMSQKYLSVNRQIMQFVNQLSTLVPQCLVLKHGVDLVKTMEALERINPSDEVRKHLARTCNKLLKKKWCNALGTYDSGKVHSANLETLVKGYLSAANMKVFKGIVGTLQGQVKTLQKKEDRLAVLPSVDMPNFYIVYRNVWHSLQARLKTELQALTNEQHLTVWHDVTLTMEGLMDVLLTLQKVQNSHSCVLCFMKQSIAILKQFIAQGIPILEIMFKVKTTQVVEIFKCMQKTTRYLHRLCCHSKLKQDLSLLNYVPLFNATLETFVYRVKAVLVANNCAEAFQMGNLRNRDIDGEDILTQTTTDTVADDDEELPEDVASSDDDEEDNRASPETSGQSASDVFD